MSTLTVTHLRKKFEAEGRRVNAVDDVSFEIGEGEFFTLLGPSGCGKSTTLRCVAGLEGVDDGEIAIDGQVVASKSHFVTASDRPIAMVFQSYAIWPHMTVIGNVTFPLSYRGGARNKGGIPRSERRDRGMEALKMVQLDHLADRRAPYLSGGQQQRVALARALVVRPKLLLLDEPLSNLDAKLREEMRFEIKELTSKLGIATIYVTHDQGEALSMSDRIAVMSDGKIMQLGTPREIYLTPVTGRVARIAGAANLLRGELVSRGDGLGIVKTGSGQVLRCLVVGEHGVGGSLDVMFRPELVRVIARGKAASGAPDGEDSDNILPGVVRGVVFTGDHIACHCETGDGVIAAKLPPDSLIAQDDPVDVVISARSCIAS
ncbi:ABC transporter ATP-binding protein [Pseudochelatococcus sp. B33]